MKNQIIEEAEISKLLNIYNDFVEQWNIREKDRGAQLPYCTDEWSKIETTQVCLKGNYIAFRLKTDEPLAKKYVFDLCMPRTFGKFVYYKIRLRAAFNVFYPGWSFCKNTIQRKDVISVSITPVWEGRIAG